MELESLRQVWYSQDSKPFQSQGPDEILALLGKRSLGPVAKMRRNLLKELILILLTYTPGILYYVFEFDGKLSGIAGLLFCLLIVFAGYFYRKNKLLKGMQCVSCQVRANLERQVRTLKKYIRFYIVAGTLMLSFMILFTFIIIHWKLPQPPGAALYYQIGGAAPWWKNNLSWLIGLIPVTIGLYFINVWEINKLYGRHVKKLQEILEEMDEPVFS